MTTCKLVKLYFKHPILTPLFTQTLNIFFSHLKKISIYLVFFKLKYIFDYWHFLIFKFSKQFIFENDVWLLTTQQKIYCIPSNSFRKNYYFMNLELVEIVAAILTFLPNKLNFCCGNYSMVETIWVNMVVAYLIEAIKMKERVICINFHGLDI